MSPRAGTQRAPRSRRSPAHSAALSTLWWASPPTGKLELQSLADSVLADITRIAVRQSITAPIAGLLQGAFAGGDLLGGGFGLFHEGGVVGENPRVPATLIPAFSSTLRAATAAASRVLASSPTRFRSSLGAASWW
jgi:hypothetical protein